MRGVWHLAAGAWLAAGPSWGADRLVSPAGSDLNDCVTDPCRSITHALAGAKPGDRVLAAPGLYTKADGEEIPVPLRRGVEVIGTAGASVTTLLDDDPGLDGRTVKLELDVVSTPFPTGIDGFTIDGGGLAENRYGMWVASTAEVPGPFEPKPYVRGLKVRGYAQAGIYLVTYGTSLGSPANSLGAILERNEVGSCGTGIRVTTIAFDTTTQATDASTLRNNVVLGCSTGIVLEAAREPLLVPTPSGTGKLETELRHNTVYASAGDALLLSSENAVAPTRAIEARLANNVFAGSGGYGVREDVGDTTARYLMADAVLLVANDFAANALGGYRDNDTALTYSSAFELNSIPDLSPVASTQNLDQDPALVAATGRLTAASPCVDRADPTLSAADDVDRQPRPVGPAPDIGADEVLFLLRGAFTSLAPLTPPKDQVYPALPPYLSAPASSFVDPQPVLGDTARPLLAYAFPPGVPATLILVKEPAAGSVRIAY